MMEVANSSKIEMWTDSPSHYDRNLNFSAIGSDDEDGNYSAYSKKSKSARDPQSHRIIEKRRRDRMNNCLADLSRLLPPAYMKKGRGRIEKTEIIEMTIKHMKHLQVHACKDIETCEIARQMEQMHNSSKMDQYKSGFLDCVAEAVQFIGHHQAAAASEHQHLIVSEDFCSRLVAHLNSHCDKVIRAASATGEGAQLPSGVVEQPQPPSSLPAAEYATRGANASPVRPIPMTSIVVNGRPHEDGVVSPTVHSEIHKVKEERLHFGDEQHPSKRTMSDSSNGESDEPRSVRMTKSSNSPSPPSTTASNDGTSSEMESSGKSSTSSSQLRQMLLANGSPSPGAMRSASSKVQADDANGMYKFKTTIQQRFTADLEHVYPPSSCLISPSSMSSSQSNGHSSTEHHELQQEPRVLFEQGLNLKRKRMEEEQSVFNKHSPYGPTGQWIQQQQQQQAEIPVNPPLPQPTRGSAFHRVIHHAHEETEEASGRTTPIREPEPTENVPIFALHPKGSYYVPMSIEYSLLRTLFTTTPGPNDPPKPLLHPITISVNFCHPFRVVSAVMMAALTNGAETNPPSVIHSPGRLLRQDLAPPGLVPAVHHRSGHLAHHEPAPEPQPSPIVNFYPLDERRREHSARSLHRQSEDMKIFRPAPTMREDVAPIYANSEAACRREYVIRSASREPRSPAGANPVNHSSRWSHLMAKRTHAS